MIQVLQAVGDLLGCAILVMLILWVVSIVSHIWH